MLCRHHITRLLHPVVWGEFELWLAYFDLDSEKLRSGEGELNWLPHLHIARALQKMKEENQRRIDANELFLLPLQIDSLVKGWLSDRATTLEYMKASLPYA